MTMIAAQPISPLRYAFILLFLFFVSSPVVGQLITEFPLPAENSYPQSITAGPNGNLWFTEYSGNKIGRLDMALARTVYLDVGSVSGGPGDAMDVVVSIASSGLSIAATANDIVFSASGLSVNPRTCRLAAHATNQVVATTIEPGHLRVFDPRKGDRLD